MIICTLAVQDEWVVCKIFHKNTDVKATHNIPGLLRINSLSDHLFDFSPSLPPLMDPSYSGGGGDDYKVANHQQPSSSNGYYLPNNNNNNQTAMMKAEQQEDHYTNYVMPMTMPTSYPSYSSWDGQQNLVKKNETVSSWGMGIVDKKCNSGNNKEHSMVMSVSQDTGLTNNNDRNAETCSAMSHMMRDNNIGRNDNEGCAAYEEDDAFNLHRPPSLPSLPADLDSLWDDY